MHIFVFPPEVTNVPFSFLFTFLSRLFLPLQHGRQPARGPAAT